MKKMVKKIIAICVSAVMAVSVAAVSVSAQEYTHGTDEIANQYETMGFRNMTNEEIQEMYVGAAKNMISRSGTSLPYSSGVRFSSGDAYSPIFDVDGKLTSTSQVRLSFTVNEGKHRLYAIVDIYSKSEAQWKTSMYGKDTMISPVAIINAMSANEDISKFCVRFVNDSSKYATDFDYTLSII